MCRRVWQRSSETMVRLLSMIYRNNIIRFIEIILYIILYRLDQIYENFLLYKLQVIIKLFYLTIYIVWCIFSKILSSINYAMLCRWCLRAFEIIVWIIEIIWIISYHDYRTYVQASVLGWASSPYGQRQSTLAGQRW